MINVGLAATAGAAGLLSSAASLPPSGAGRLQIVVMRTTLHRSCCARPPPRRRHPSPRWAVLPIFPPSPTSPRANTTMLRQPHKEHPSAVNRMPVRSRARVKSEDPLQQRDGTAGRMPGCCCRRPSPAGRVARQTQSRALGVGSRRRRRSTRCAEIANLEAFYILNMDKRQAPTRAATRTGRATTAATQLVLPQPYRAV